MLRLYQLDKDYLQLNIPMNERIYSPNTCIFLHFKDNINIRYIEEKMNNPALSKYFGVTPSKPLGTFTVHLIVNNNYIYRGTYDDEIVAANVYNYWYEYYHNYELIPLLNNVPYVPMEEWILHNRNPKTMCEIIERNNS